MEPIIGTLALLATKLNYGQVNAESRVVEWVRGGPDYFFLFFISIIDYTAPTFSTISTLKSPGYDPSNVFSLDFHHSFGKGGFISERFLLWLKSPQKRCQITILTIFYLRRWIVLKIVIGTFFGRFEPTWKTFWY